MAKIGYQTEAELRNMLEKSFWKAFRVSGSISCADIFAFKYISSLHSFDVKLIEVKKTRAKTFYFNPLVKSQLRRLKEIQNPISEPICFFAIKFTNRGWKIISVKKLEGKPIKWEEQDGNNYEGLDASFSDKD